MNIGTFIYTWIYGELVGSDEFGNKYYCNSKNFTEKKYNRWVIFNGEVEATKVPPHWHAWLHKTVDEPPIDYSHKYDWQKQHSRNLTGTKDAYYPDSHPLSKNNTKEEKEEYEKWTP
tara:strand:- start:331 stop:681 length:351 start_codon:yes stop_codon:yes gene_type:complete